MSQVVVTFGKLFHIVCSILIVSGQVSVTAKCVLLEQRTQLVVSRKVRQHRPFVPPGGAHAGHVTSTENSESRVENVSKSGENSVSNEDSLSVKHDGILARCINYIKSFNIGEHSPTQQMEPPAVDPFVDRIRPGNLSDHFEMVLRVQPITEPDCPVEGRSLPRQPDNNIDEESKDEFVWQTTNVRIGIETLAQYCDLNFDGRALPAFPAVLQKFPSPSEKEAAMKEHMSRARLKSARNENDAARNKLDAESESNMETKVVVRVMVVNSDHSCVINPSGRHVVYDTRPLTGHVMMSELLRRQLGAGVTSKMRLTPLTCDPLEVNSVQLCPLLKTVSMRIAAPGTVNKLILYYNYIIVNVV